MLARLCHVPTHVAGCTLASERAVHPLRAVSQGIPVYPSAPEHDDVYLTALLATTVQNCQNMYIQTLTVLILLLLTRIYAVLSRPSPKPRKRNDGEKCALAVFLGSGGGHTSEALTLTSSLDFTRYSPRIYIVSEGDTLSVNKAISLERSKVTGSSPISNSDDQKDYEIVAVPRARRVHQAVWTVLPTLIPSILACIYLVTITPLLKKNPFGTPFADLLILNGPGTCVTLCFAVVVNKLLGLPHPKTIYVESYARVQSLSLSGKILRYFVDRFLVQWPALLSGGGREECYGCLV
ncbi:glycosyltransferase family 1 protein [Tylopilus felleus]